MIRLRDPRGAETLVSVRATARGGRARVGRRDGRFVVLVTLRRHRRTTVRIVGRTSNGRKTRATRRYRRC